MAENWVHERRKVKVYRLLRSAWVDDTSLGRWVLGRGRRTQKHGGIAVGQGEVPYASTVACVRFFVFLRRTRRVCLSERRHQASMGVVRSWSGVGRMGRVNDTRP